MLLPGELAGRDVVAVALDDERILVQAVDVAAGIGPALHDTIEASPTDVGYWVTRTAASELWCLGAEPSLAAATTPDREVLDAVLDGVRTAFAEMGVTVPVVRSAENYVETATSTVSVAVTGTVEHSALLAGALRAGHQVFLLGDGYSADGTPLRIGRWPLDTLARLLDQRRHLVQVVPVGSGGVRRDLEEIRQRCGLVLDGAEDQPHLDRPGGPGLQFLVVAEEGISDQHGLRPIGELKPALRHREESGSRDPRRRR